MKPRRAKGMDPRCCENCVYFHRHYVANKDETVFTKCGTGHCTQNRLRHVDENQTCDAFQMRKPS